MERRQTKDYARPNREITNSDRFGTELLGDESEISEDEKAEVSATKKESRNADLDPRIVSEFTDDFTAEGNSSCFIGDLTKPSEVHFVTGSSYEGTWDALGMSGVGRYTLPHGTIYEGEIRDGLFHGQGSLYWSKNQRLDVVHLHGELKEHRYTPEDGFVLDTKDWSYCKFPDRRFHECLRKGLRPGGRALKTARQPTTILPAGCYDTGDGIFDSRTQRITSLDGSNKVLRVPSQAEVKWIIEKCRRNWTEPTGYRPDLNENWSENPPELPYNLPMSQDSPDHWWKRLTTFTKDYAFMGVRSKDDSDDYANGIFPSSEMCICGQLTINDEPCRCISGFARFKAEESEHFENTFSEGTLEETDENRDLEQVFSEPSRDLSIDRTLKSTKSVILGRLEKPSVTNGANNVQNVTKKIDADTNSSSNRSRELFLENSLRNVSLTQSSEKDELRERIRHPSGKAQRRKPRINDSSENLEEAIILDEEREGFREEIILPSDKEEKRKDSRKFRMNSSEGKFDEKRPERKVVDITNVNDATETFNGNEAETDIGLPRYEIDEQTLEKIGGKKYKGQNYPAKETKKDKLLEKYVDGSQKQEPTEMFDYVSESVPREKVTSAIKAETTDARRLETNGLSEEVTKGYHDETSMGTRRMEKQSNSDPTSDIGNMNVKKQQNYPSNEYREEGAVEKSSMVDKNMKSLKHESSGNLIDKALSKEIRKEKSKNNDEPANEISASNTAEDAKSSMKSHLQHQRDRKLIEDSKMKLDTDFQSRSTVTLKETVISLEEQDERIPKVSAERNAETSEFTTREKSENSFRGIFSNDTIMTKSMTGDESSVESEIDDTDKDNTEIERSEKGSGLKFVNDGTTFEAEKNPKTKRLNETEENVNRNSRDMNKLQMPLTPPVMSAENRSVTSKSMHEKSSSADDVRSLEKSGSLNSSKNEVTGLNNVHPSLVTLVPTKRESLREKDETTVCQKASSKVKPEVEPVCAHVWRLSGLNQNYGPKTKIEDLLFHPALTAPRSESFEYARKPCNYRVCRPTMQEAETSASSAHQKRKPCKVPTKSRVSSVHKNSSDKK